MIFSIRMSFCAQMNAEIKVAGDNGEESNDGAGTLRKAQKHCDIGRLRIFKAYDGTFHIPKLPRQAVFSCHF